MTDIDTTILEESTDEVVDVEVPVLCGPQRQGDVFVFPAGMAAATTPTADTRDVHPAVEVVDGGTARHNHTLVAAPGAASWTPARDADGLAIGIVTVADGEVCYLSHDEHSTLGLAPGAYVIRRQREQAESQRLVAD